MTWLITVLIVAAWFCGALFVVACVRHTSRNRDRADRVAAARCGHPTTRGRIHYAACPHCDWVGEMHHHPEEAMAELDAHQAEEIARAT